MGNFPRLEKIASSKRSELISLFHEAKKDPGLNLPNKSISNFLKKAKPIKVNNNIVGFTMPTKSKTGKPRLGNIYIKKSERKKGYAYKAAKDFLNKNPDMVWFASEKNKSSIKLAKKLGLEYSKRGHGSQQTMVFENISGRGIKKLAAAAEFAPGLPDIARRDPIKQKGLTRLVIQKHEARHPHYDVRLQDDEIAHSWATRKWPFAQQKSLIVRQPTHTAEYMDFQGRIPEGYGAGTVKKVYDKTVDVVSAGDNKVKIVTPEGEMAMINMKQQKADNWLFIKQKPFVRAVTSKPDYKEIKEHQIDINNPRKVLQPKVDGAHTIFELHAGDAINRAYSYRNSKRDAKVPIDHTHQVPGLRDINIPRELSDTILRGELFAHERASGLPMSAEQVTGLLNAGIPRSRMSQAVKGALEPYIFDIVKYKGKDLEKASYAEKLKAMREVQAQIPELKVAETADTPEKKRRLMEQIKNMRHPDTVEGFVEWDLDAPGGTPKRVKLKDTHEVYIRRIRKAKTIKTGKEMAGAFEYSLTPSGPVVGRVGTGFTEKMRKEMLKHPKKYINLIARVRSQQQFPSGALRAPSFYQMHVEKNL